MDRPAYDPRFSNVGDTTERVESVSSHSAFGFVEVAPVSRVDLDSELRAEFSSFEAATDEDFKSFEGSLE